MRKLSAWTAVLVTVASLGVAVAAAGTAQAAPYCEITWGSLAKTAGALSTAEVTNVRAGRHDCYDRLVVDLHGSPAGYTVQYVAAVRAQGSGAVVPLRGGAFLEIVMMNPSYDAAGNSTYNPANRRELVNVTGWRTFRQVAAGGSFEGYTTFGLGVRARLPFRVFTLAGPGSDSRVVIDVAHQW